MLRSPGSGLRIALHRMPRAALQRRLWLLREARLDEAPHFVGRVQHKPRLRAAMEREARLRAGWAPASKQGLGRDRRRAEPPGSMPAPLGPVLRKVKRQGQSS